MSEFQVSGLKCLGFLMILLTIATATEDDDSDFFGDTASSLIVEHSFDQGLDPVFTKRGTINIRSITAGNAHFREEGNGLSYEDTQTLKNIAEQDGLYRIRVKSKSDDTIYVASFIKACALVESRLADTITINLDAAGNLLGASIKTGVEYCSDLTISERELVHFTTDIEVQQMAIGPTPETQSYVQKIEKEKVAKAKGEEGDNRSFFSKYWMYIVPFVIIMMVAQNMDAGGGGGGGGGGR